MEKTVILLALTLFCGTSALNVNAGSRNSASRITAGDYANINQFPYSVSIQRITQGALTDPSRGHVCGGVLISFQHVLTAASCVFTNVNGSPVPINTAEYRIFAGQSLLTNDNDQIGQIRSITRIERHPEYIQPPANINNIAILMLNQPYGNTTVTPLSLPASTFNPADFTICQIASWGSQNYTQTASTALRYTNKYVYNQNLCTTIYSQIPALNNIFSTMVCAASFDIVSSGCYGDEGVGLVCGGTLTGIMVQTNACAMSSFPEVYTRVSNYTTWIRNITGGASSFRPDLTLFAIVAIITAKFMSTA